MSFFQNSVLNKHLKAQDNEAMKNAYGHFVAYFHNSEIQQNIRDAKEEQFQEGFLRELFVKILGYTLNPQPNYNLTTELKNENGAKKADGAILQNGKALGVIELKGTDTKDLDKINTQAFHYKNNQTGCIYVITSNFEKLRFFINHSVEHIEFNLFSLTEKEFQLLWLCLHAGNLLKGVPLKVKEESLHVEENVTKELYKDYSAFRTALWQNMIKNSGEADRLLLFKKTQKLLDRFLFIFFAEDGGLLPPNYISKILKRWELLKQEDAYKPLYEIFNQYFGYINTGRKGQTAADDIFAYNGGLFLPDEILDKIIIDDDVLHKHVLQLTNYDFQSEVDVNILGHIFENSLNEIENISAGLEGQEVDKTKTRRKKDGVFYTPKYITKYIVDNTMGKLCTEKKAEIGIVDEEFAKSRKNRKTDTLKRLDEQLKAYRDWLLSITICDPACGSGAFLNQALECLIKEHTYIDALETQLLGYDFKFPGAENHILEKNIFGVDINEESVEIAKLSLWLRTAQRGRALTTLNKNIKCGNSLIDDPAVAGEKAFVWKKEFPTVFDPSTGSGGGFDVVIGNPPYVFAREKIAMIEKEFYSKNYNSADYQINTYLLFIEKTIGLIKANGLFGLIVPNAWLMVYSGKGLRNYILGTCNLNQIINLEGFSFEGVNVETIIILAVKSKNKENEFDILLSNGKEFSFAYRRFQDDFTKNEGLEFNVFSNDLSIALTKKMFSNSVELDSIVQIKAGLQAYEKDKGNPKQTVEDVIKRPYDYNYKFDDNTHRYLDGKDVGRYWISWSGLYLKYGDHLASPRTFNLFNGEKIIVREITGNFPKNIISTYSNELYLFNRSNIAIVRNERKDISLKYIVAILNSTIMSYYFVKNTAKSVRKMFPKIILQDLRKFPFKEITIGEQQPFIQKTDKILSVNEELMNVTASFMQLLQSKFEIKKLTTKLQNWPELEFKEFLKELKKAKVQLSLAEEAEWMQYFNQQKQKANELKTEIDRVDAEIDKMVYELYELTEEEIRIVEGS